MIRDKHSIYEQQIRDEVKKWQHAMRRKPSFLNKTTKGMQRKINNIIPERVHVVVTRAVKEMTRAVIFGAVATTIKKSQRSLEETELHIYKRIKIYTTSAAAEGAVTGFGGILLGLADLPLWLSIKMKLLFEIATNYGFDINDYKERIYILYIFQLTFSSQENRNKVYEKMARWEKTKHELPNGLRDLDWRTFQLEYRDYIDLAKLLQLIPGVGAVAGALVNHRLTNKLGSMAMNAYRMRILALKKQQVTD